MKNPRHFFYLAVGILAVLLAYFSREILAPFVLAAIFAYILNPLVSFLSRRTRLPRVWSVALVYVILIGILTAVILNVGVRLIEESDQFAKEAKVLLRETSSQTAALPYWFQPVAVDILESVRSSLLLPQKRVVAYLPGALNRTISVLVFLVATFYFLKDGHRFLESILGLFPNKLRQELELIMQKINKVLGDYLRGQLFLILIMSVLTYVGLLLIGVRYALILSIFTGFAEIIPFVGPLLAAGVAVTVAVSDQFSRITPSPFLDAVAVASLYTVLRQIEDLFIIPQVMGRMTKLHPLAILVSVLVGGHLFGMVGFLVAVPIVASLNVVLGHIHEKTS